MKFLAVCLTAAVVSSAQIGYPGGYPPGGYPPGGYPPGYPSPYPGGSPIPRNDPGIPTPKRTGKQPKDKTKNQPLPNFRGKLKQMDSKSISLELDDYRVMEFRVTAKTRFTKNGETLKSPKFNTDIKPGDQVSVEGLEEPDASMTAVTVYWEKAAASAADKRSDSNKDGVVDTWKDSPPQNSSGRATGATAPRDPEDPGPPKLKHETAPQANEPRETASSVPLPAVNPPQPTPAAQERPEDQVPLPVQRQDPLIQRAAEAALEFTESLPNYICQEMMSRAESQTQPAQWRPVDVVTMDVVYENGKEDYRKLAVNGKPTDKKITELGGATSSGEFGTVLIDLFSPATAAEFHSRGESRIAGVAAKRYDFEVRRENSHWDLHFGPQTYSPAYSGSVWIDPATARVLRIEMQARDLPKEFPADHVESATDYQYVRLGGTQQFLLPVHAETLSCQRGTSYCSRNTIDFRNYHKYSGESTVEYSPVN